MSGHANRAPCAELANIDARAMQFASRVGPLELRVAQSEAECGAAYRLRYLTALEKSWVRPEEFPDGLERDAYDDTSVQVMAWDGNRLVATIRLVLPTPGHPLPTEAVFNVQIGAGVQVIDVGRACVASNYRGRQHRVLNGLLGRLWIEMRARDFTYACGICTSAMARLCRRMGLQVVFLGVSRPYWGEERYPVLICPVELSDLVIQRMKRSHTSSNYYEPKEVKNA